MKSNDLFYFTHSNLSQGNKGDSTNDRKLIASIPSYVSLKAFFPLDNSFSAKFWLILKNIFYSFIPHSRFLGRTARALYFPAMMKKILHHQMIIYVGCTPLITLEQEAFAKNPNYPSSSISRVLRRIEHHLELFTLNRADYIIIENQKVQNILHFFHVSAPVVYAHYYTPAYFHNLKTPLFQKTQDILHLAYTGRFHEYDYLKPVIYAINSLKEMGYNLHLHLFGDGITKKETQALVNSLALDEHVTFHGSISHRALAVALNDIHCLILPMVKYICPSTIAIKILEGVLAKKIIITNSAGNNASLFTSNDLILDEISSDSLAHKIELVYNNFNFYLHKAENFRIFNQDLHSKQHYTHNIHQMFQELYRQESNKIHN